MQQNSTFFILASYNLHQLWPKMVNLGLTSSMVNCVYKSHHDSCQQANPLATVGVRDHVAVADGQKGDGYQPHCSKEGTGHLLCIMIPVET